MDGLPAEKTTVLGWWKNAPHPVVGLVRGDMLILSEHESVPLSYFASFTPLAQAKAAPEAFAALKRIEYVYQDNPIGKCPWCGGKLSRGHKDDCERQAALSSAGL
jgi:hypothetical protein